MSAFVCEECRLISDNGDKCSSCSSKRLLRITSMNIGKVIDNPYQQMCIRMDHTIDKE